MVFGDRTGGVFHVPKSVYYFRSIDPIWNPPNKKPESIKMSEFFEAVRDKNFKRSAFEVTDEEQKILEEVKPHATSEIGPWIGQWIGGTYDPKDKSSFEFMVPIKED